MSGKPGTFSWLFGSMNLENSSSIIFSQFSIKGEEKNANITGQSLKTQKWLGKRDQKSKKSIKQPLRKPPNIILLGDMNKRKKGKRIECEKW